MTSTRLPRIPGAVSATWALLCGCRAVAASTSQPGNLAASS
jgi:hypothetical protein